MSYPHVKIVECVRPPFSIVTRGGHPDFADPYDVTITSTPIDMWFEDRFPAWYTFTPEEKQRIANTVALLRKPSRKPLRAVFQ